LLLLPRSIIPSKEEVKRKIKIIQRDLFNEMDYFTNSQRFSGYSTSILTPILKKQFPQEEVKIGFAITLTEKINQSRHHFFTRINDFYVDAAYGQFDERYKEQIIVDEINNFSQQFLLLNIDDVHSFTKQGIELYGKSKFDQKYGPIIFSLYQNQNDSFVPYFNQLEKRTIKYTNELIKELEKKIN
jgi:hypothetical protein